MYDDECLELAKYFLTDVQLPTEARRERAKELAQHIQDEIESWLEGHNL